VRGARRARESKAAQARRLADALELLLKNCLLPDALRRLGARKIELKDSWLQCQGDGSPTRHLQSVRRSYQGSAFTFLVGRRRFWGAFERECWAFGLSGSKRITLADFS